MTSLSYSQNCYFDISGQIVLIIDGQEIPRDFPQVYDSCRANCGNSISYNFKTIQANYPGKNIKVSLSKSKLNISLSIGYSKLKLSEPETINQIFNAIVGNTCVLLNPADWNKKNKEIGIDEAQIKKSILHYKTINNFWIRQHQLFSFVTGMLRFALHIGEQNNDKLEDNSYLKKINELVSPEDINNAILNNDPILARENFDKLKDFIVEIAGNNSYNYPISENSIKQFIYFINKIKSDGIKYWFPHNVVKFWATKYKESHGISWESWLKNTVGSEMKNGIDKRVELMP